MSMTFVNTERIPFDITLEGVPARIIRPGTVQLAARHPSESVIEKAIRLAGKNYRGKTPLVEKGSWDDENQTKWFQVALSHNKSGRLDYDSFRMYTSLASARARASKIRNSPMGDTYTPIAIVSWYGASFTL